MRRPLLVLSGVILAAAATAQPRPPSAPAAEVLRVHRTDYRRARATLAAHRPSIVRCLADARVRDPGPLASVRVIDATIALDRAGAAVSAEFDPPLLSRGLSACLAEGLLDWSQGAPVGSDALVVLRIAPR